MTNLNDIEVNLLNFIIEGIKKELFLCCTHGDKSFYYLPATKIKEHYKISANTVYSILKSLTKKGYLIRDTNENYSAWYQLNANKI